MKHQRTSSSRAIRVGLLALAFAACFLLARAVIDRGRAPGPAPPDRENVVAWPAPRPDSGGEVVEWREGNEPPSPPPQIEEEPGDSAPVASPVTERDEPSGPLFRSVARDAAGFPPAPRHGVDERPQTNSTPSPVVISEIHYHPTDDVAHEEFIELTNRSDEAVDLGGWNLRSGIRFSIPTGRRLAAGSSLVVARDPVRFSVASGLPDSDVLGPFEGKLSNSGETIELVQPDGSLADAAVYTDRSPWPTRADGGGSSLERIALDAPGTRPGNWAVAERLGDDPERPSRIVIDVGSPAEWFENLDGRDPGFGVDPPWYDPSFDGAAAGFATGRLGVGTDVNRRQRWVLTQTTRRSGVHSILTRIPFDIDEESLRDSLAIISLDWDDGVIVYLNGREIARRAVKGPPETPPPWNAGYHGVRSDANGDNESRPGYQEIWTGGPQSLRIGRNWLAIANYNVGSSSSDLFSSARVELRAVGLVDAATPGRPNAARAAHPRSVVLAHRRSPAEPQPSDAVTLDFHVDEGRPATGATVPGGGASEAGSRRRYHLEVSTGTEWRSIEGQRLAATEPGSTALVRVKVPAHPSGTVVRYRLRIQDDAPQPAGWFPRIGDEIGHRAYLVAANVSPESEYVESYVIDWSGRLSCGKIWRTGLLAHRGTVYDSVGVKYRGDTSCGQPKSGIQVRFPKSDRFFGHRRLSFLAGWQDRSILREVIAWKLYRDLGAPHCLARLAALHRPDGELLGLYVRLEAPSREFLTRNGLDADGALWKCRSSMRSGRVGGLEVLASGRGEETERVELDELVTQLYELSGEELVRAVGESIDVETLLDYQAVKCLISDEDGFSKNWLLYHGRFPYSGEPGRRWAPLPWDLDLSFGQINLSDERVYTDKHPLMGTRDYPRHGSSWNLILDAVLGSRTNGYYVKALYGRIASLLEEDFHPDRSLELVDAIDRDSAKLAGRDLERYPRWGFEGSDASAQRDRVRKYLRDRHTYLTRFLARQVVSNETSDDADDVTADLPPEIRAFIGRRERRRPTTSHGAIGYRRPPRVQITEIADRPADPELEFIEFRNLEAQAIELSGWTVPAVDFEFPAGARVGPGETFVLARRPARLVTRHAGLAETTVFGPFDGRLANEGEDLRLLDDGLLNGVRYHPETIDVVRYRSSGRWPSDSEGSGATLELRDVALDNDVPEHWTRSDAAGGSPGSLPTS